jgi:hypothetical protein
MYTRTVIPPLFSFFAFLLISIQIQSQSIPIQAVYHKEDVPSRCLEIVKHPSSVSTQTYTYQQLPNPDINQFVLDNTQWFLTSIDIDKHVLSTNRNNYTSLLNEVRQDLSGNINYFESSDYALLALTADEIHPIYYGRILVNSNNVTLKHRVENCPTCSKDVNFSRVVFPNQTLTIRLMDEDNDKSDVIYILNFVK